MEYCSDKIRRIEQIFEISRHEFKDGATSRPVYAVLVSVTVAHVGCIIRLVLDTRHA